MIDSIPKSDNAKTDDMQLAYKIAFSRVKGLNIESADRVMQLFGSEEAFFNASERDLRLRLGSAKSFYAVDERRRLLDEACRELEFIRAHGIDTYYVRDDNYPRLLRECPDAPGMLYGCGRCNVSTARLIAIVGTRHATHYGIESVNRLVDEIADKVDNPVIVSGLAYGIDAAAHRAALRRGLPTVAVVAHGLNTIYPADHRSLAAEICERGGMLVTDYISTDAIHRSNFLARNRIVAGLCECTVVAESAVRGGAMSTARLARSYNREVMAVPGRLTDMYSAGCNELIATLQAAILRGADDLIAACNWPMCAGAATSAVQKELFHVNTPQEQSVMDYIMADPDASVADIARCLGLKVGAASSLLARMELDGLLMALPGGRFAPA